MQRPESDWKDDLDLARLFDGEEGQAQRIADAALAPSASGERRRWRSALLAASLVALLLGVGERLSRKGEGEPANASGSSYRIEGRGGVVTLEDSSGQVMWILAEGEIG